MCFYLLFVLGVAGSSKSTEGNFSVSLKQRQGDKDEWHNVRDLVCVSLVFIFVVVVVVLYFIIVYLECD